MAAATPGVVPATERRLSGRMFVPALAFAWVLASFSPAQPPLSADALEAQIEDTSGERVLPKLVTPELVRVAQTFLDLPLGAERFATVAGQRYVFVLELHYHPPGYVGAPSGHHKGVTVYELR
jgi:hypothetical protein